MRPVPVRLSSSQQRHRERGPERDDEQVVVRDDGAEDLEARRARPGGRGTRELLRAPQHARDIAEDQHQRVGEEQLVELLAAVEMAQQQPLDHAAEQRDRERRRRAPRARSCP